MGDAERDSFVGVLRQRQERKSRKREEREREKRNVKPHTSWHRWPSRGCERRHGPIDSPRSPSRMLLDAFNSSFLINANPFTPPRAFPVNRAWPGLQRTEPRINTCAYNRTFMADPRRSEPDVGQGLGKGLETVEGSRRGERDEARRREESSRRRFRARNTISGSRVPPATRYARPHRTTARDGLRRNAPRQTGRGGDAARKVGELDDEGDSSQERTPSSSSPGPAADSYEIPLARPALSEVDPSPRLSTLPIDPYRHPQSPPGPVALSEAGSRKSSLAHPENRVASPTLTTRISPSSRDHRLRERPFLGHKGPGPESSRARRVYSEKPWCTGILSFPRSGAAEIADFASLISRVLTHTAFIVTWGKTEEAGRETERIGDAVICESRHSVPTSRAGMCRIAFEGGPSRSCECDPLLHPWVLRGLISGRVSREEGRQGRPKARECQSRGHEGTLEWEKKPSMTQAISWQARTHNNYKVAKQSETLAKLIEHSPIPELIFSLFFSRTDLDGRGGRGTEVQRAQVVPTVLTWERKRRECVKRRRREDDQVRAPTRDVRYEGSPSKEEATLRASSHAMF
ncbi:hypothetical protein KM043_003212 [Ampulex compressa]|nr:hypothetical protein KM043_003212 [Ampulex compressa]